MKKIFFLLFLLFFISTTKVFAVVSGGSPLEYKNFVNSQIETLNTSNLSLGPWVWRIPLQSSTQQQTQDTGSVVPSILSGWLASTIGVSEEQTAMGPDGKMHTITYSSTGAINAGTNMIAKVVGTPAASSVDYVADLLENVQRPLGVQPAYAQGIGFSALRPTLELWKIFRNLAYFFYVVIFLIVGFLIMFRSKIGGQAAVTVQQALPKLIVSLLLVTFSYAIAGLLIDIMYIVIYLIIGIFNPYIGSVLDNGATLNQIAFENNFIQNAMLLFSNGVVKNVAQALGNIVTSSLNVSDNFLTSFVSGTSNLIFTVIIAAVILFSIFKVFFALLQAYIGIFFSVIFSPIQLLVGALPGQNTFGTWIKGLLGNLLVFPTIILLIYITFFFTKVSFTSTNKDQLGFSAPQLTSNQGSSGYSTYSGLIALGAILIMPEALKIAKGIMSGKLDISSPEQMWASAKNDTKRGTAATFPVAGAALGAGIGGFAGVVGGLNTKQPGNIIGNLWHGYTDPTTGKRMGGIRGGVARGTDLGGKGALFVDNAFEGKFLNPNSPSRLLEEFNKNANNDAYRKRTEEEAKAAQANKRPGP